MITRQTGLSENNDRLHALFEARLSESSGRNYPVIKKCLAALNFHLHKDILSITLPHCFFSEYYESAAKETVEKIIRGALGTHIIIKYYDQPTPAATAVGKFVAPVFHSRDPFEGFVISDKNRLAVEAARAFATDQTPGRLLVIQGPPGSGKTRLLSAIQQAICTGKGQACCIKCKACNFEFKINPEYFWSAPKAVLLDDAQDLEPAEQNYLADLLDYGLTASVWSRMAIVLSQSNSDSITERLAMRLDQGLKVKLCSADLGMRMQYAEMKCQELGLPRKQAMLLARHTLHIPALSGLLQKLAFYGKLTGEFLSAPQIEKLTLPADRLPDWQRLIEATAREMHIKPAEILGQSRKKNLVIARQAAMYLCWHKLGLGYSETGRLFGGKDHSTVIHSIKKIQQLRQNDNVLHNLLTKLEQSAI